MQDNLPLPGSEHLASDPAVVVLSGGQDSVTCLGVALSKHSRVFAISFAYGQKHYTELRQAAKICDAHMVQHSVVDLRFFAGMVTSALTSDGDVSGKHSRRPDLPASFVPNRNALFLTLAHAVAQELGAKTIYAGVCQTDYSGYPDCRSDFVEAFQDALNLGYDTEIRVVAPLMDLTKAETFELADKVGFLDVVLEDSHTCYNGDRTVRHEWGYGCGSCPACQLRERGFHEFVAKRAEQHGDLGFAAAVRQGIDQRNVEGVKHTDRSLLREPSKAPVTDGPVPAGFKPRGFA